MNLNHENEHVLTFENSLKKLGLDELKTVYFSLEADMLRAPTSDERAWTIHRWLGVRDEFRNRGLSEMEIHAIPQEPLSIELRRIGEALVRGVGPCRD